MTERIFIILLISSILLGILNCEESKKDKSPQDKMVYTFRYANTQTDNHPRSKSMFFFKQQLEKETGGRIKVDLYTDGVLGREAEVLDMVKNGTIEGCRGGLFIRANKKYILYTLPFLFENIEQVLRLMNSEYGTKINQESTKNGYYIPACGVAGGFRNITNNIKPIISPQDLKGLKMRAPPLEITIKTFNILGALPQQIAYTDTYLALKEGVVHGQENPFSNIADMKFYEVQKYLSIVNWQIHPDPFYVNPAWYNNLPTDLKDIFDSVAQETIQYSNNIWLESEASFYDFLTQKLITNNISTNQIKIFAQVVQPVWQYYVDNEYFTWTDINQAISITRDN